ncbi:MAG TPA: ABC transporter ATP-binding protein [Frankiaceae bacterium]|nr:ABC transporter ATP-binding protein [Frankiaceae bacterium]
MNVGSITPRDDGPLIRLAGITRVYPGPPAVEALRGIDLVVDEGEFLAVVGRSGSGKSTLLNVIGLLDTPTSGRYDFIGVDVTTFSERELTAFRSQRIGFVFQAFHLLEERDCIENVLVGLMYAHWPRQDRRRRALEVLAAVGLSDRALARTGELSGGERQRVAIARAIAPNPALLLCDEPTGNLDSATAESVLDLLAALNRAGTSVLVITHDAAVARAAQRIVTLQDGRLDLVNAAAS